MQMDTLRMFSQSLLRNSRFWARNSQFGRLNCARSSCWSKYSTVRTFSTEGKSFTHSEQDFSKDPFVKEVLKMVSDDFAAVNSSSKSAPEDQEDSVNMVFTEVDEDEYEDYIEDNQVYEEVVEEVHPISLQRGKTGVFDIDDLCQLLRAENAIDSCVIRIPSERHFVDYMVIVSGRSQRHLLAMAEYIKRLYKMRRVKGDPPSVEIEGKRDKGWLAMDLGNIAVHLFMPSKRRLYDIESLWTVGEEFDEAADETNQSDPYAFLFQHRKEIETEGELHETENEIENVTEEEIETERGQEAIQSFGAHSDNWHRSGS